MDGEDNNRCISLHSPDDFKHLRAAGKLAAETLDMISGHVKPGVSTGELDQICHEFMVAHGAVSATLGYRGYPKSSCISLNHVVCHGIPGERRLLDGDILNIDVTVILDGWYGDTSRMFVAGNPSTRARTGSDAGSMNRQTCCTLAVLAKARP
jgi:methionyl aminopeptidase